MVCGAERVWLREKAVSAELSWDHAIEDIPERGLEVARAAT
jgi:hypothetical protein